MEWSDKNILKAIKNTCPNHTHILETSELTFEGFPTQADFATLTIEIQPLELAVELKSVKEYLKQFKNKHISYERILRCIKDDFWDIYEPQYLCVTIVTRPRGGITSKLTIRRMK